MDSISPAGNPAFFYTPQFSPSLLSPTTDSSTPGDEVILSSASMYSALDTMGTSALYSPSGQTLMPTDPLFGASTTLSLLDTQGAAALSYLTSTAPPQGSVVNALA